MKKITSILMFILISFIFVSCGEETTEAPIPSYCEITRVDGVYKCTQEFYAFDTLISSTFYIDSKSNLNLDLLFDSIEDIILEYDKLFDPYEAFEGINNIYAINRSTGPMVIDPLLYDAIEYALENQDVDPDSGSLLFNIAYQPVLELWHDARYNENCDLGLFYDTCPLPSEEALNATYNTDPNDIVLNEENLTIEFLKENMGLDLGGFAKGYVSMILEEYLAEYNANYILNLGASNVLVGGKNISNPNGDYFAIGLTTPSFNPLNNSYYGAALIESTYSVVTSGSYQRYFRNLNDETDETYYHHIIDPRTNYPGGEAIAVSIITTDTGLSDILSTAIFLMEYEEALAYVNSIEGLEAIWYFSEDDIRMSENFMDYFTLL